MTDTNETLAAELRELRALVARLVTPKEPELPPITVAELWAAYDAAHSAKSWWAHERSVVRRALAELGKLPIQDLTPSRWEGFRSTHLAHLKPASRNQVLKRIRAMVRWGVRERLVADDPLEGARRETHKRHRRTELAAFDEEKLLELCETSPAVRAAFVLALETGMRRSEVVGCRLEWICFERQAIHLPGEVTKTGHGRTVALTSRAVQAIREHLASIPPKLAGSPWLFPSPAGGGTRHMSTGWATHNWWIRAKILGLKGHPDDGRPTLHDCRHTAAGRAARAGATIPMLQAQFGWQNPAQAAAYINAKGADAIALRDLIERKRESQEDASAVKQAEGVEP